MSNSYVVLSGYSLSTLDALSSLKDHPELLAGLNRDFIAADVIKEEVEAHEVVEVISEFITTGKVVPLPSVGLQVMVDDFGTVLLGVHIYAAVGGHFTKGHSAISAETVAVWGSYRAIISPVLVSLLGEPTHFFYIG
jgi:hypothetical protein